MLNSAMIVTGSRVMSKFVLDWLKILGRELPIVAFLLIVPLSTFELTQLLSPDVVHVEPVYPFAQTHEHWLPLETLTPPLEQGLDVAQVAVALLDFSLGTATRKTGRRTARMTMTNKITQRIMNHFRAMPQHRRGGFWARGSSAFEPRASPLRRPDRPKNTGQEPRGLSGVSRAGLGNMCRISEMEPELRRRPVILVSGSFL